MLPAFPWPTWLLAVTAHLFRLIARYIRGKLNLKRIAHHHLKLPFSYHPSICLSLCPKQQLIWWNLKKKKKTLLLIMEPFSLFPNDAVFIQQTYHTAILHISRARTAYFSVWNDFEKCMECCLRELWWVAFPSLHIHFSSGFPYFLEIAGFVTRPAAPTTHCTEA